MKSLVLRVPGTTPQFDIVEREIPYPIGDFVLVKVAAVGVCHHDIAVMSGLLRRGVKRDLVLGHEVSGIVVEKGKNVANLEIGAKVVASLVDFCGNCNSCIAGRDYRCAFGKGRGHSIDGGFADYIAVPERHLVQVKRASDIVGASLYGCPIGVGIRALQDVVQIKSDDRVVIFGAGGGLGSHAVQVASAVGAQVIAFTSSVNKVAQLENLGIESVFLLEPGIDPSDIVLSATSDMGADFIFNPIGGAVFRSAIKCLNLRGKMILAGDIYGHKATVNMAEIIFRDASIIGVVGADIDHISRAAKMVSEGGIEPVVGETFRFDEIVEAYEKVKSASIFGRVVLIP